MIPQVRWSVKRSGDLGMRIARAEVLGVAVPLAGSFRDAYVIKTTQKSIVVRLTSNDGSIGLGNIDPAGGYSPQTVEESLRALNQTLVPAILGLDPMNITGILRKLDAVMSDYLEAKAAVEMACCDLMTRFLGIPIHTYFGGAVKDRLLFNGWIGLLSPDEAAQKASTLKRQGFRSAKIKVTENIKADRDRVKAVREAVGRDFNIRIDANGSYDPDTSIELAHLLEPFGLQLFEQPAPANDIKGMARVRREGGGVPIMADESVSDHASLIDIIKAEAADIVKVKVMKQGGLVNTMRLITTAEGAGLRCVIGHGFGLGVSTIAETMLAATSSSVIDGLECIGPLHTTDDIITKRLDISSGVLDLPAGPGLSVSLDEAKLARYCFSRQDHQ